MSYLVTTGLTKRFGPIAALDAVSLSVKRGESVALLGPSGCGKTTLLRVISGLERPDRGTVIVEGDVLTGPGAWVPAEDRRIGMVFQDWALFPHLTVAKNVAYGLERSEIEAGRVDETLEMVGLVGVAGRLPTELSGGQAQRVAIARALAPRPRLLLFDEPFSNLDATLRIKVRADVAALMRDVGMTSVFVTHDQEEAFVLGDRVAVMRDGGILQVGAPAEIYDAPDSAWIASFVGEANLVPALADGETAHTAVGEVRLAEPLQGECLVALRPEYLAIGTGDAGLVRSVEFYGHDTQYEVELEGVTVFVRGIAAPRFQAGDPVSVAYAGPRVPAFGP